MLAAVNSHDGREQRLDPRQRFSQAVVVRLNDVGAQLGDARATPVCRLEAFTLDDCGFKQASYNVPMGPPIMAPGLMTIVGAMGLLAALLRREDEPDGR